MFVSFFSDAVCILSEDVLSLSDWTGTIKTPDFDTGQYPPNQICTWRVTLSKGSRIRLVFDEFDLDPAVSSTTSSGGDCQDYVKVSKQEMAG